MSPDSFPPNGTPLQSALSRQPLRAIGDGMPTPSPDGGTSAARLYSPSPTDLKVTCITFADGERSALLVDAHTGIPLFEANHWALSEHRKDSASDHEQALRGAMLLHLWAAVEGFDLHERIRTGRFFSKTELNSLQVAAMLEKRRLCESLATSRAAGEQTHQEQGRGRKEKRSPLRPLPKRSTIKKNKSGTQRIRLHYSIKYIEYLASSQAFRLGNASMNPVDTFAAVKWYEDCLKKCVDELKLRMQRKVDTDQFELSDIGHDHLLETIELDSPKNRWRSPFIRHRNRTLILTLIGTGMRKGEALNLKVSDINFGAKQITIRRSHDDPKDPRGRQPTAKRGARKVPLGNELAIVLRDYIKKRAEIAGTRKHGFLFVSRAGAPLSLSSYTEIFASLRPAHSGLHGLRGHTLRYKWNELFSDDADAMGLSEEREKRVRREVAGWSDGSSMPDRYNKRRSRRQGAEASARMQNLVMNKASTDARHPSVETPDAR